MAVEGAEAAVEEVEVTRIEVYAHYVVRTAAKSSDQLMSSSCRTTTTCIVLRRQLAVEVYTIHY